MSDDVPTPSTSGGGDQRFEVVLSLAPGAGVDVWDLASGALLRSVALDVDGDAGLAPLGARNFIVAQRAKPLTQVFAWRTAHRATRSALPERAQALAASPCGAWLAAGTPSGHAYIWSVRSGALLRRWRAHYKAVTTLCFSACGGFVMTGGADAVVAAWPLDVLVADDGDSAAAPTSLVEWSTHALAVSRVWCGGVGGAAARVLSSSLDCSVRVWDLASRRCQMTVTLPAPARAAVADASERYLYAACADGVVYRAAFVPRASMPAAVDLGSDALVAFARHDAAVGDVALSFDDALVVSAADDGAVRVWDAASGQLLRTLINQRRVCARLCLLVDYAALRRAAAPGGGGSGGEVNERPTGEEFPPLGRHVAPASGNGVADIRARLPMADDADEEGDGVDSVGGDDAAFWSVVAGGGRS